MFSTSYRKRPRFEDNYTCFLEIVRSSKRKKQIARPNSNFGEGSSCGIFSFRDMFFRTSTPMFDLCRKHGHVCVLLVLSVFVACFFVDDCGDFQRTATHVYTTLFTNIMEADFDFDDDNDEDFVLIRMIK